MRFVLTALVAATLSAHAQIQVDIALKRNLYIIYEPILATVTITNLTGGELSLADSGQNKWFGLQLETMDGRPIPPVGGDYTNAPLELGPQQKISRTVNLTPLFPISEFGGYRARATVFTQQGNRFSHRLPQSTQLYLRIEDTQAGKIYCTHQLGRFLTFGDPNVMLDRQNQVHVLQNSAPKTFIYSKIGLNGEVLERKSFNEFSTRPALRRGSDGSVLVVGGQAYDPTAPPPEQSLPSLHDRPVDLPGAKQKPGQDDKRPENLLSR